MMTMRVTYHFDGDEFMFGEPERVRTETIYLPYDGNEEGGQAYDGDDDDFQSTDEKFMEMLKMIAKRMRASRMTSDDEMKSLMDDIEVKAGRVLSRSNVTKLQQAISLLQEVMATGGSMDIEMKKKSEIYVPVDIEDLFQMKSALDEICEYHGLSAKALHDGIVVSGEFTETAEDDILSAMEDYAVKVRPDKFDPDATDADGDGIVQEGTPFARPAVPKVNKLTESAKKIHETVDKFGHVLDEDERKLLRYRATRSLDDAAKKFGMTREKVRQKEMRALKKVSDASWTAKPRKSQDVIKTLVSDYGDVLSTEDRQLLTFRADNTLEDAAKKFGGTRESIRQREARALAAIRKAFDSDDSGLRLGGRRDDPDTPRQSLTTKPGGGPSSKTEANLAKVRALTSSKFNAEREFGDFNRRLQKHTVDGTMGKSDIIGMNRMYENLIKKAKKEGIDVKMFENMSSQELEDFFQAIAYGKVEPDTRAEFLAMLMADFELGMRKISRDRRKNGPQGGAEPKIEVDKILKDMATRMDK
jgi:DNA-directed RNA polymerase specialized sigma24 family protein